MEGETLTPGQSAALGLAHTFPSFLWPTATRGGREEAQSRWEKVLQEKWGHSLC